MSTSALLSFWTAFSPPNPDPMTTTWCRRFEAVSTGWALIIWLLLDGDCVDSYVSHADLPLSSSNAVISPTRAVERDAARQVSETDQRTQRLRGRGYRAGRVEGHVDDHTVDAGIQHLGLNLLGDEVGVSGQHALAHLCRDLFWLDVFVQQHGQQDAGLQRRGVAADLLATFPHNFDLARQLVESGDHVEVVEVPSGQRDCLFLAAATDHQRNVIAVARVGQRIFGAVPLAGKGRSLTFDHRQDDLQCLVKPNLPIGEGAEFVSQFFMFELDPSYADAHNLSAPADHVEGGDDLRQQGRVAVGI